MRALSIAVLGAAILSCASPASAQTRVFIPCSLMPCSTVVPVYLDTVSASLPAVVRVPVPADACFTVSFVSGDAAAGYTIVDPEGVVYRTATTTLSVTPTVAGWYSVQVQPNSTTAPREQAVVVELELSQALGCVGAIGR